MDFRLDALKKLRAAILENEGILNAALYEDLRKSPSESYMCETGMALEEISFHMFMK